MTTCCVYIAVAGINIQIIGSFVGKTSFPRRCIFRADAYFAIDIEVVCQRSFADEAYLRYIIGIAAAIAKIIVNAVIACIGSYVIIQRIQYIDFLLIAFGDIMAVDIGTQAAVLILYAYFIGNAVGDAALEIPIRIGFHVADFRFSIHRADIYLHLAFLEGRLRSCKSRTGYTNCQNC